MTGFKLCLLISILIIPTALISQEDVLRPRKASASEEYSNTRNTDESYYRISFGVEAGINYNMFSQKLTWTPEVPNSFYNVFESASGISPYFAVLVDFPIAYNMGIQGKIAYDMRSYSNTYNDGIVDCEDFTSGDFNNAGLNSKLEITGADISVSALFRYNFAQNFVLTVGPMLQLPAGNYDQTLTRTLTSEDCYFDFGFPTQRKTDVADTTISILTRFGIDLGLAYQISLGSGLTLAPQIRLNYMFSNIGDDETVPDDSRIKNVSDSFLTGENKKLQTLKFGVALWF